MIAPSREGYSAAELHERAPGPAHPQALVAPHTTDEAPWFVCAFLAVLLGAGNALLLEFVGRNYEQWWYVACCAAGLMLLAMWAGAQALGRRSAARIACWTLGVVTLCNFNIWAFSHLSNLMVFIGLYFFALFGLTLGAVLARLVSALRLAPRGAAALAVAVIAASWSGGLALEAAYFPGDAQLDYLVRLRRIPPGDTAQDARQRVTEHARTWVAEHYPPGGLIGYVRWSLASGQLQLEVPGREQVLTYTRPQRRGWFLARLVLSLGLLTFGVGAGLSARSEAGPRPE